MHGEAVSMGLMAACHAAIEMGMAQEELARTVGETLERAGLPLMLPRPVPRDALRAAMGLDKKASRGKLRLILPRELGSVEIVEDPPEAAIEAGFDAITPA